MVFLFIHIAHAARRHVKGSAKKPTLPLPLEDCSESLRNCYARLFEKKDSMEYIIAKKRKEEIWRMLSNLPLTIGEAFRPKLIRDSWQKAGYIPLDTIVILSKCSLWEGSETFSVDQKRRLIDGISELYPFVALRGRVSDLEMETVFPFLPALEKAPVHDLAQLAVNRDRCCIVTHPGYYEGRTAAVQIALTENPNLKPRAPPKAKKVVEAYTLYSSDFADKFNVDDIKHQLQIRGVAWGPHCKKKAAFLQLWLDNSALPDKRVVVPPLGHPPLSFVSFQALQNAEPPTPPRGGSAAVPPLRVVAAAANPPAANSRRRPFNADPFSLSDDDTSGPAASLGSAPSTPQNQTQRLTPKRQAALRAAGKPWLNT